MNMDTLVNENGASDSYHQTLHTIPAAICFILISLAFTLVAIVLCQIVARRNLHQAKESAVVILKSRPPATLEEKSKRQNRQSAAINMRETRASRAPSPNRVPLNRDLMTENELNAVFSGKTLSGEFKKVESSAMSASYNARTTRSGRTY